jgi:hypothetical protein
MSIVTNFVLIDRTKPIITLKWESNITIIQWEDYIELNATATDNADGNISDKIIIVSNVDTHVLGDYNVTYTVSDRAGNESMVIRYVRVVALGGGGNTAPVLNSVSVSGNTLYSHWNNNYSIGQNWNRDITFRANWTDADWNSLSIVINWVEYTWISETITLNLAKNEIKKFTIKEFDWKDYSNEILVRIYWS